jgi:hypothetical protein
MNRLLITTALLLGVGAVAVEAQAPAVDKVPVVAVAGCVAEQPGGTWQLTNATDPVPSIANAPTASQPYKGPMNGKATFQLIGISEFDLPSHKGQTVLVKGLFIKAAPVSRLNVTSVTMLATTCPAPSK